MLAAKYELEEDIITALGWVPKINQTQIKTGIEEYRKNVHQTSINRTVIRLKKAGLVTELGETKTYGDKGVSVPLLGLTEGGLWNAIYYVLNSPETIKQYLLNYSEYYESTKYLLKLIDFIIKNVDDKTSCKVIKDFFLWSYRLDEEKTESNIGGSMLEALLIEELGVDVYIKFEKESRNDFDVEAYEGLRKWVNYNNSKS